MATKKEDNIDTKKASNSNNTKKSTAVKTKKVSKKDENKEVATKEKKVASKKNTKKEEAEQKVSKASSKKIDANKKVSSLKKDKTTKNDTKKEETDKTNTEKKSSTRKNSKVSKVKTSNKKANTKTVKTTKTKRTSSKVAKSKDEPLAWAAKPMLSEYYDLPYRYNETVVKILAQTPTTIFVYWDISDDDRSSLISKYGENFFYETKPILIIHNLTKNYSFEVEINDFANSWYIRTQEPDCNYVIELGRKNIEKPQEYIYINSSNRIVSPNDHILFEKAYLGNVLFRNVKTHVLSSKDFGSLRFINDIDKLYGNLYDVYSRLYKDEILNDFTNPSSGEFIMR